MNLVQRLGMRLLGMEGPARSIDDPRWWGGQVIQSMAGQAVTADSALQLGPVQAVLERLGGSVSCLPMQVFRRTDDDQRVIAKEHPLNKLLNTSPNRSMSTQLFRDEQQRHLASWRNCYALIVPGEDGSPIGELIPIHPKRVMKIERGTDGWVYYTIRRLGGVAGWDTFREDEIWHIRKAPLTEDGLAGRPVWETSRETLGYAQAVRQFGALYFKNGGAGGGTLEHPGTFKTKEDRDDFLEHWRSGGTGLNQHRDKLLLHGIKYSRPQLNNDEAQFNETKRDSAYEVSSIWNMPGHMIGLLDRATFSNIEQQSIDYVVHTLAPWICAWEQSACQALLIGSDQEEYFVEINVRGLLRGDIQTRWAAYALGRQWGWLSINDVRRLENLDPIGDEGDDYLQPLNMAPAGAPALNGTPAPDAKPSFPQPAPAKAETPDAP